tara:strand:+ start:1458 stop:1835 length:378 start_codon:yes stop_codon:yes gene_type:complete
MRCSREDLPAVEWATPATVHEGLVLFYCGAPEDPTRHGEKVGGQTISYKHPPEDPRDGCPYGLGMGRFTASVLRYARRRTKDGGRVPNRYYDRCSDPLIIEACHYLEYEQERNATAFDKAQADKT